MDQQGLEMLCLMDIDVGQWGDDHPNKEKYHQNDGTKELNRNK